MALAGRTPPRKAGGSECPIGKLIRDLPPTENAALQAMLADFAWQGTAIRDALIDEGYEVGRSSVQHHRRGDCACER